jgi:transposase
MEQRERFIRDERLALYAMTELCERYGISRKTGYKWLARFDAGGRQDSATGAVRRTSARIGSRTTSRS